MLSSLSGALRRLSAVLVGIAALSTPVLAHEGHDHDAPTTAAVTSASPRIALTSDLYEAVGVVRGGSLKLYLDRFGTNEPVTDAKVVVTPGGEGEIVAVAATDGTYTASSSKLDGHGPLEIVLSITGPAGDDLLIGTLDLPEEATPARAAPLAGRNVVFAGAEIPMAYLVAAVALAIGFLRGLAMRARWRRVPIAGLALVALVASTAFVLAHEGHDQGEAATPRASGQPAGDKPERLPDGSVFLPKPSQRILEVRTVLTKGATADRSTSLIGRVIADPNRSGLVQSINGGRVGAPEGASLPRLGQAVRRGDILAVVETPIIAADRATLAEKVGDIEQQTTLAEARLARARRLLATGAGTTIAASDAELEVEGLKHRRDAVREIRSAPEVLRAPIDGVLATSRVVAGQVVAAQDILFQIVDPTSLFVEAVVFHESDMPTPGTAEASATTTDAAHGTPLRLRYQGASRALQQQAVTVQFAIVDPPPSLSVGQPVTVVAPSGKPESGIILPREAVVRGGNGETLIWRHAEPERFEPNLVRTEALDARRVVVRAGLKEGQRVVVRGADLVNQIR